jgi:hypothetical protein
VEFEAEGKPEGQEGSKIYIKDVSKFFAYLTGYRIVSLSIVSRWYRFRKTKPKMTCLVPGARKNGEAVAACASKTPYTSNY